jgi:hypothetical protein
MKPLRWTISLLVVGTMAGCSGSDDAEPPVTAAPPAQTPSSTPDATVRSDPTTSSSQSTTESPTSIGTTTSSASPDETRFLPVDLGPLVDGAPGVETPGEIVELSERVWLFVPSEPSPTDANVLVPLPEDAELIAAYGRAMTALYGQVTQDPIPVEPSEAMQRTFVDGGAKYSENVFAVRNAAGQHLGFPGDGDVLRPVVLADPRSASEAFIFDCAISGSHYLNADGTLADGEVGGTIRAPLIVRLVLENGVWLVADIQDDERACA